MSSSTRPERQDGALIHRFGCPGKAEVVTHRAGFDLIRCTSCGSTACARHHIATAPERK